MSTLVPSGSVIDCVVWSPLVTVETCAGVSTATERSAPMPTPTVVPSDE
jgi:hypothetical protein